jgi:hypothetical protein
MSTIFLDPVQMDATAGAVGEHAREAEAVVSDLQSTCSAAVPLSIAGWLGEELEEITVTVRLVSVLYTLAALDTALRAQQIQADQSLVAAGPWLAAMDSAQPTTMGDLAAVLAGSSVVGCSTPATTTPMSAPEFSLIGGASYTSTWMGDMATMSIPPIDIGAFAGLRAAGNPAGSRALMGLLELDANLNANTLAPNGTSFVGHGLYEGPDGRRGTANLIYEDPRRPGSFRVG